MGSVIKRGLGMLCLITATSSAFAFSVEWGELTINSSNRISLGATWRTQSPDQQYIGKLNIPGQQALCDTGSPSITLGALTLPIPDPLGACVLSNTQAFLAAPGSYTGHASDDANLNYQSGDLVAAAAKWVNNLSFSYKNFRLVTRTIAVIDPAITGYHESHVNSFGTCAENVDNDPNNDTAELCGGQPARTRREKDAEDQFNDIRVETAYLEMTTELFDRPQVYRLGKQIVRWGQSLAIPLNSINSINPPDAVRLGTPGFNLDEIFDPTNLLYISSDLTDSVRAEFVYLLEWKGVRIPPGGLFNSPVDTIGPGLGRAAATLGLGFSREDPSNLLDDAAVDPTQFGRDCFLDREIGQINYGTDSNGNQVVSGDGGINDRFSQGAHRGQMQIVEDADGNAIGLQAADGEGLTDFNGGRQACLNRNEPDESGQWGLSLNWYAEELNSTEFGFFYLRYKSRLPYTSVSATQAPNNAASLGLPNIPPFNLLPTALLDTVTDVVSALKIVDTLRIQLEYPEIDMYGMSFSTNIGDYSVSGELSYRPDMPLQVYLPDVIFAGQGPAFGQNRCLTTPSVVEQYRFGDYIDYQPSTCPDAPYGPGEYVSGFERFPVMQGEVVILSIAETNPFFADTWIRVLDIGFTKVNGMPDTSELIISSGAHGQTLPTPGRAQLDADFDAVCDSSPTNGAIPLNPDDLCGILLNPTQGDADAFADSFSWGYRFINFLTYEQVLGGTVQLTVAFFHDVQGNTPGPHSNFVEGRKRFLFGTQYEFGSWRINGTYDWQLGAKQFNSASDKDSASLSLTYTF